VAPSGELRGKGGCCVFAGKTVWSTPERLRGEVLTTRRYTNLRLPLPTRSALGSIAAPSAYAMLWRNIRLLIGHLSQHYDNRTFSRIYWRMLQTLRSILPARFINIHKTSPNFLRASLPSPKDASHTHHWTWSYTRQDLGGLGYSLLWFWPRPLPRPQDQGQVWEKSASSAASCRGLSFCTKISIKLRYVLQVGLLSVEMSKNELHKLLIRV